MTDPNDSWDWRRFGRVTTALAVGAFAAYASYDHMRELALQVGQAPSIARLLPFSVDGLIVFATYSMDGLNRFWPRLSFWLGVGATISANVLSARHALLPELVSAWAPVSLLCVIETWSRRNKTERWSMRRRPAPEEVIDDEPEAVEPEPVKTEPAKAYVAPETAKRVAAVAKRNPGARTTEIAAKAKVSESTVRRVLKPEEPPVVAAEAADPALVSA